MGRRRKNIQPRLANELDNRLFELVSKGRPVLDRDTGAPVLDENGKPRYTPPTAADLQVARARINDLGIEGSEKSDDLAASYAERLNRPAGEPYRFNLAGSGEAESRSEAQ